MSNGFETEIDLNGGNVLLFLLYLAVFIVLIIFGYKSLKKTVRKCTAVGVKVLTPIVLLSWGIPSVIPPLLLYYHKNGIEIPIWINLGVTGICLVWLVFQIMLTVKVMGAGTGMSLVFWRMLLFVLVICAIVITVYIVGLIITMLLMMLAAQPKADLVLESGTRKIILIKQGQYYMQDMLTGERFAVMSNGSLASDDLTLMHGDGVYYGDDGEIYTIV